MDFRSLFARKQPATAAEIRAAIEQAEAESAAACAAIDRLRDARAKALLELSDDAIDQLEAELAAETRRLDRADAAIAELRRRAQEAELAERQADRDATHAAALGAQARGLELLRGQFADACTRLAAIAGEIRELEAQLAAANQQLAAAGDERRVSSIEAEINRQITEVVPASQRPFINLARPLDWLRLPNLSPGAGEIINEKAALWPRRAA